MSDIEEIKKYNNIGGTETQDLLANNFTGSKIYTGYRKTDDIVESFTSNSYGRYKMDPANITSKEKKDIHDSIADSFCEFFVSKGYKEEQPVSINSGIDNSVYFIGAPTSVLKPYLLKGTIPDKGICMQQPSFRTHNAKHLKDESLINRSSIFTGIACMSQYKDGKEMLETTIKFFIEQLEIPLDNIAININSQDYDMQMLLKAVGNPIPLYFDTKDPKYYIHTYGLGNIVGRNFNFILKDENTGVFNDIGNYIIIEDNEQKYGFESGYGTGNIMKHLYSLDHVLDTSVISNFIKGKSLYHRKLQDAIISSVLLYKLGIIPTGKRHDTPGRAFRKYLSGIKYNQEILNISKDELQKILNGYEAVQYNSEGGANTIISYL